MRSSTTGTWLKGILIFPLLSGLLLLLGWPPIGIFPVMFLGLTPYFFAFDEIAKLRRGKHVAAFLSVFTGHFLWVGYSLKWLKVTSPQSYLTAITLDSLSLSLAMIPVVWVGLRYGRHWRFVFFAAAWLSVEYLNQQWLLGAPYFALGNGFGMFPQLIQHYEFTGIEGGSLWLLVSNYLIYLLISSFREKRALLKYSLIASAVIFVPMLISLAMYGMETTGDRRKVAVLHTFLDPTERSLGLEPSRITDSLFAMSEAAPRAKAELLVWPEVIINNMGWISDISQEKAFTAIYRKLAQYPNTTICTGGYGFSVDRNGAGNPYAVHDSVNNYYYVVHNIALSVTYGERSPIRSKQHFVPFQERIPLLKEFPFMGNFADIVGANAKVTYFDKGVELHRTKTGIQYTPVLCYESVFPLDMASKAKEADLITISANENWNKDLSGSDQYLYNNVGMAIQGRIPLAKSSNSGISCVIDKKGRVLEQRKGRDTGLIIQTVQLRSDATLYTSIAGLFYWTGILTFVTLYLFFIFSSIRRKPAKS